MTEQPTLILSYDPIAVALHWVIAISILLMLPLGFYMGDLPISIRFGAYTFHKSLGITVLTLSIFRLVWRLLNPPPAFPTSMKPWEKLAAHAVHWGLYFLMIAMPLSGWLMVSAMHKFPTVFFWMGEVPFIPMPSGIDEKATAHQLASVHYYLAIGAIVLIAIHVGAAVKHHFITRDGVILRMLPRFIQRRNYA